jgi:molecular chaperone GrpE
MEAKVSEEDRKGVGITMSNDPEKQKDLQELARQPVAVSRPPEGTEQKAETEKKPPVDPLEEAHKEAAVNRDRWIRAVADLENYKKRSIQERSNLLKYRNEDLLRDLVVVMDNMDRSLNFCAPNNKPDPLTEGVCLVSGMFKDVLGRYGVKEIKALGEIFDPHLHEAVARVPAGDNRHNQVVEELEKGYMYQDRLLRPSKVVVAVEQKKSDSECGQAR